jgi:D-arabinose 5-phosphate isomerase GutQ
MKDKVCQSVDYVNKINQNLKEIKKEELEKLLEAVRDCRRIILVGEGRSGSALRIGIRGINKRVFHEDDSSWRWRNITSAVRDLEQKQGKTLLLINSGSGKTTSPKETAKELSEFINADREKRSQKFIIATVTSHPKAEIAQQCDVVLKLKGREEEIVETNPFESGIIGDQFELASMILFRMIKEAINNDLNSEEILALIKKEMKAIGKMVDYYLGSRHYQDLVAETASRQRIIIGGRGPGKQVGEMAVIRMMHVNRLVQREAWPIGSLTPPPKPGDILLLISFSGETKSTLEWANTYKTAGGIVFSIVGTPNSALSKENGYVLNVPEEDFYTRAAFLISPLAGGVMEKLRECGTKIPQEMIRVLSHTKTE